MTETREPRVGDVCRWSQRVGYVTGFDPLHAEKMAAVVFEDGLTYYPPMADLEPLFNLTDLLSGDRSALEEVLGLFPGPWLLEVGEEEKRQVVGLPNELDPAVQLVLGGDPLFEAWQDQTGMTGKWYVRWGDLYGEGNDFESAVNAALGEKGAEHE